ncbi:MAG: hypothetical protein JW910_03290 [Anaerolineae bacterium]|nr:hypothetical protein [Anaerolineae bacterium]
MRVAINERRVRRNRQIAQYSFFGTLGLLILGLFVINAAPPTNALFMFAPIIILPVAMGATLFSVRMANAWLREPQAHVAIQDNLKGLSRRSAVYHYLLPAKHVLITPQGVFIFIVRGQDGYFTYSDGRWSKRGGTFSALTTFFRQDGIGKPNEDAEREAAALQQLIDQIAPDSGVQVEPTILFTSANAEFEVEDNPIPVLHATNKQLPSLKNFLRDVKKRENPPALDDDQIAALEHAVGIESEAEEE